jgi:cytochrome c peroxidase
VALLAALGVDWAGEAGSGPAAAAARRGLPPVPVPAGNPLTAAKVSLGRKLFFDPGLSADRSVSCASCHRPDHFYADDVRLSKGVGGQLGERNAVSLLNAAYSPHLLWDGLSVSLEDQARYPVTHPREMSNTREKAVQYLAAEPAYRPLFAAAFDDATVTWDRVSQAVASFERTLLSGDSPFDRFKAGDPRAISQAAQRGLRLFQGRAGCAECHRYSAESPFFSDGDFHNTGVGWSDEPDLGRYKITKAREDKGAFRTPSLRNVARTAPYMHDGEMATLPEVLDFYSRGGGKNPFLDEKIKPLDLTEAEKSDLLAFLSALTGDLPDLPPAAEAQAEAGRPAGHSKEKPP